MIGKPSGDRGRGGPPTNWTVGSCTCPPAGGVPFPGEGRVDSARGVGAARTRGRAWMTGRASDCSHCKLTVSAFFCQDEPVTSGLRERKKLATRLALHDAALGLVAERGLDRVSVDDIAERADVSPRTFFNYFASKVDAVIGWDPSSAHLGRRLRRAPARRVARGRVARGRAWPTRPRWLATSAVAPADAGHGRQSDPDAWSRGRFRSLGTSAGVGDRRPHRHPGWTCGHLSDAARGGPGDGDADTLQRWAPATSRLVAAGLVAQAWSLVTAGLPPPRA